MGLLEFLGRSKERRRSRRIEARDLVAYYWTGSVPGPRDVCEIGLYGARIIAPERFYAGTLVQIVLEDRAFEPDGGPPHHVCVYAKAVRPADDGFCIEFLFANTAERKRFWRFLGGLTLKTPEEPASPAECESADAGMAGSEEIAATESPDTAEGRNGAFSEDQEEAETVKEPDANSRPAISEAPEETEGKAKHMPIDDKQDVRGQALIEFALILPLLFLLIVNVVNFGGFFYAWIAVANAARAGAQYMVMGSASVMKPAKLPTFAQVAAIVQQDTHALPNSASIAIGICTNNNGTVTCSPSGPYTPPLDPEPAGYVLGTVDVTYTYQPFIQIWDFSNLGIHLTLPPTTIHRQAAMRLLQ